MAEGINGPVASGDLFIFYGLLKKGAAGMPAHIDLEAAGEFLGPARFRGALYHLDGYPGVVDGDTLCRGVRYRMDDVGVLEALDAFEAVLLEDVPGSEYVRRRIPLLNDAGRPTGEVAWIYWFNQSVDGYSQIETGDWPLDAGQSRFA